MEFVWNDRNIEHIGEHGILSHLTHNMLWRTRGHRTRK
jgi:hypothetical protein